MHYAKQRSGFFSKEEIFFGVVGIVLTVTLAFLAIYFRDDLKNLANVGNYGLAGMFIFAFIASSTLSITPIAMPYWIMTLTLPSILASRYGIWAPVLVAVVTAVAVCLGQFITFMIGYSGRTLSEKLSRRFRPETYDRSVNWIKKTGSLAIFFMTLIPNPIHLPMTLAIALLKYPPYKFMFYSLLGISVRSFIIAFSGYYGMDIINQWIASFKTEGIMASPIMIAVWVITGIFLTIIIWQIIIWIQEIQDKNRKYRAACNSAQRGGKPLLVVGGPWGVKSYRRLLGKPAHGNGDVCLDIDRRALEGHPCAVVASCTYIPFSDNSFGALFSSHVLEHMPTTQMAEQALSEMNRVAGSVFIAYPSRQSIAAWIIRDHHIWVWQREGKTLFKQRKNRVPKEHQFVETTAKS